MIFIFHALSRYLFLAVKIMLLGNDLQHDFTTYVYTCLAIYSDFALCRSSSVMTLHFSQLGFVLCFPTRRWYRQQEELLKCALFSKWVSKKVFLLLFIKVLNRVKIRLWTKKKQLSQLCITWIAWENWTSYLSSQ